MPKAQTVQEMSKQISVYVEELCKWENSLKQQRERSRTQERRASFQRRIEMVGQIIDELLEQFIRSY
jgi:hypothetical protein